MNRLAFALILIFPTAAFAGGGYSPPGMSAEDEAVLGTIFGALVITVGMIILVETLFKWKATGRDSIEKHNPLIGFGFLALGHFYVIGNILDLAHQLNSRVYTHCAYSGQCPDPRLTKWQWVGEYLSTAWIIIVIFVGLYITVRTFFILQAKHRKSA